MKPLTNYEGAQGQALYSWIMSLTPDERNAWQLDQAHEGCLDVFEARHTKIKPEDDKKAQRELKKAIEHQKLVAHATQRKIRGTVDNPRLLPMGSISKLLNRLRTPEMPSYKEFKANWIANGRPSKGCLLAYLQQCDPTGDRTHAIGLQERFEALKRSVEAYYAY